MIQKLYATIRALVRTWSLGSGQNLVSLCKRKESESFRMAQMLYETIGALVIAWPLGKGQNYVNLYKKEKVQEMIQKEI